ncbi:hypothetical protein [Pseudoalteromonas prydzensis]|uniref:hypothetical protein n=1 Tax=Pseudoalteromonas prydzensis TaxID=182141 RepID=UPI000ADA478D|nr:hypothetical protein [Pseudoalteromonas prydzensis]MBE0378517.1 hypothetical protein [Pseudoalteromonas prydzensis ACAM 620]
MKIDNSINLSNTNELKRVDKQPVKPTTDQKVDFAAALESEMKLMNGGGGHPIKDKKPR